MSSTAVFPSCVVLDGHSSKKIVCPNRFSSTLLNALFAAVLIVLASPRYFSLPSFRLLRFCFPSSASLLLLSFSMPDKGAKLKKMIAELKRQLIPAVQPGSEERGACTGSDHSSANAYTLPDCWESKMSKGKGKM